MFLKVKANFMDSGSTKSKPDVMGMRHTREVVGVKVLRNSENIARFSDFGCSWCSPFLA